LEKQVQEQALAELAKKFSSPEAALSALAMMREKRMATQYVKYWQATDKQASAIKQFGPDVKVFGFLGGNRSGKTEIGTFIDVAWALGKEAFRNEPAWEFVKDLPIPEPPNNIWVVGLDFPTLRDVIWGEKFRRGRGHPALIPDESPFLKKKPNDTDFQIFFANGSVITGKSADSGREKFQGSSVDLIHIDEECEVEVYDECYQRTVDCEGRILLTLTPLTDLASGVRQPWVFDLHRDWKRGITKDARFVQLSVLDNPYVPEVEKEKLKLKWAGHPEERARLYGDFVQRSGLVYPMWSSSHVVAPRRIPEDWLRIVSIDPAATGTTAALWGAIEPRTNNLYLYREYYESDSVVSSHAKNLLLRNSGDAVDIWIIDPFWGRQRNAETHKTGLQLYRESGLRSLRLADVGSDDYGLSASFEYLNGTLDKTSRHPKVFIFDTLVNFQEEIVHYVWDTFQKGEMRGQSKEKPIKRNDHLMNAFQYMCAGKFKGGKRALPTPEESLAQTQYQSYT
jgi:phage terminase large subunit-like protein